MVWCRILLLP
uniref:Pdc2 n=1 Tax=Arundo donax TaxID=35708 RepID=A0A0A8Y0C1_ARUDO